MTKFLLKVAAALALLVAVSPAARAATVVIDFEALALPGNFQSDLANFNYVEDGFRFTSQFAARNSIGNSGFAGSTAIFPQIGPVTMVALGGVAFSVDSLRLARTQGFGQNLTLTGTRLDGSTLSTVLTATQTLVTNDLSSFEIAVLTGFNNLTRLDFTVSNVFNAPQFDNITVSRVPLPASLPLLAGALALTAALARRRRAA